MTFGEVMDHVAQVFEAIGALVLLGGLVVAVTLAIRAWRQHHDGTAAYQQLRDTFSGVILLGLEILVAADLVRTVAVAPTVENVAILGGIVLIRTFLSFSLEIEIDGVAPWRRALTFGAGRPRPRRVRLGDRQTPRVGRPATKEKGLPMAKQDKDTLYVIAAAYDDVDAAVADYESVKELYRAVRTSHDFDAAVLSKDEDGTVHIVKKHEQPTRHGAAVGLGWGLAVGVAATLFPPLGIGIVTAGGAGAVIGGVTGHVSGGMSRHDLKELGDTLDAGQAGLIAVYETNLADQIAATIKAANRIVSKATDMAADQLAEDMRKAEQAAVPEPRTAPADTPTTSTTGG